MCPNCQSTNVLEYQFVEGASATGKTAIGAIGCLYSPLLWLMLPFLSGKKTLGYQCQYCSNRWKI